MHVQLFGLSAERRPKDGWGAAVGYEAFEWSPQKANTPATAETAVARNRIRNFFTLSFFHKDYNDRNPDHNGTAIELANSYYSQFFNFSTEFSYHVQVSCHENTTNGWGGDFREPREPQVRRLYTSAVSFRSEAMEELDNLERFAEKQIPTGEVISASWLSKSATGRNPPMPRPLSQSDLTDAQKQEMLAKAKDDIQRRRKLIELHYAEMYTAMITAFPLGKIFDEHPQQSSVKETKPAE